MTQPSEVVYHHDDAGSGTGLIVGLLFLVVVVFLLFYYGIPAMRAGGNPQINVPSKIDVNMNQPGAPAPAK